MTDPPDTGRRSLSNRVAHVIDLIRPAVQSDGGDIELVEVSEAGVVQIRFHGECVNCPSSSMTLEQTVQKNLMNIVPEVTEVVAVP